jgi:hypothetical protein
VDEAGQLTKINDADKLPRVAISVNNRGKVLVRRNGAEISLMTRLASARNVTPQKFLE